MYCGRNKRSSMCFIDYERREREHQRNRHTKLRIGCEAVIIAVLLLILLLCCIGHERVASEVVGRLPLPIVVPVATVAPTQDRDDRDRDDKAHHRYYDPEYKDYHEWNADEQRYWREYWTDEHRPYIDWDRAS